MSAWAIVGCVLLGLFVAFCVVQWALAMRQLDAAAKQWRDHYPRGESR